MYTCGSVNVVVCSVHGCGCVYIDVVVCIVNVV